jgi:hypothetical protein
MPVRGSTRPRPPARLLGGFGTRERQLPEDERLREEALELLALQARIEECLSVLAA